MAIKIKQELAGEAQIRLEETISPAYHILLSMSDELCDAALWPSSTAPSVGSNIPNHHNALHPVAPPTSHPVDGSGGALDQARHRYRTAVTALRASISSLCAISSQENVLASMSNLSDEHAACLRKEIEVKNKHVKLLIDQHRNLITDISVWQSPQSL